MRPLLRSPAVAALIATVVLLAGCGDDDDTAAADGDRTETGSGHVDQADAICSALETASAGVELPADETDYGRYIGELRAETSVARDELAALESPAGSTHDDLVSALDDVLEALDGAEAAAAQGDTVSAEDVMAMAREASAEADRLATEAGLSGCSALAP